MLVRSVRSFSSLFLPPRFPPRRRSRRIVLTPLSTTAFPCQWSSCGKSFSRKDNLQQHVRLSLLPFLLSLLTPLAQMSMVHGSPVPGSSAGTPNFKTKRASRAAPKTAPKAPPIKQEEREASSSGSSSSDSPEREEGMRGEPERKRIRMEEGRAGTGSEEEEKVEAEESYERTRC